MGDIRVYTEVAILSFTHLQALISWQTLLTAIVTKLTVDSRDGDGFNAIRVFTVSAGSKTTPDKIVEPVSA